MISDTLGGYVFIRALILFFRSVAPLSILYFLWLILSWFLSLSAYRLPVLFDIFASVEVGFYFFVYLPKRNVSQRPASHPPTTYKKRKELFDQCLSTVPDPGQYISHWFGGASLADIGRESLKEWLCWGFFNKATWGPEDDHELDGYVSDIERAIGKKFPPDRGAATSIRLTLDQVKMQHRPLIYYIFVGVADAFSHLHLLCHSFQFYSLRSPFASIPWRPMAMFTRQYSPAQHISYYYRPHTSETRLPILYIQGIGILTTYLNFLAEFNHASDLYSENGDVGVIVLEIKPISFCITHAALPQEELCAEILSILEKHGWEKFVLIANSYGTIISTHLLQNTAIAPRIGPMVMIDPVNWLLHLPDTTYNFTRRHPQTASEHQLHYFASMDMGASHTLARCFFWSESILWLNDIKGRKVTVFLSGRDNIIDSDSVWRYLTMGAKGVRIRAADKNCKDDRERPPKTWKWDGVGLDVLWFDNLNHAEIFAAKRDRKVLIDVAMNYCSGQKKPIVR